MLDLSSVINVVTKYLSNAYGQRYGNKIRVHFIVRSDDIEYPFSGISKKDKLSIENLPQRQANDMFGACVVYNKRNAYVDTQIVLDMVKRVDRLKIFLEVHGKPNEIEDLFSPLLFILTSIGFIKKGHYTSTIRHFNSPYTYYRKYDRFGLSTDGEYNCVVLES